MPLKESIKTNPLDMGAHLRKVWYITPAMRALDKSVLIAAIIFRIGLGNFINLFKY
ncbi:hypothetical protein L0244_27000 [bacterium]|nr:hypothetical protein [bacterium]